MAAAKPMTIGGSKKGGGGDSKGNGSGKKKTPMVSQSIPAHFYSKYVPPDAPLIRPMQPNSQMIGKLPPLDGGGLPPSSPDNYGITKLPQFSLTDAHPMSLPVHKLMGPSFGKITPASVSSQKNGSETDKVRKDFGKMQIGSFTCMQMMGGGIPARTDRVPVTRTQPHSEKKPQESAMSSAKESPDDDMQFAMDEDEDEEDEDESEDDEEEDDDEESD